MTEPTKRQLLHVRQLMTRNHEQERQAARLEKAIATRRAAIEAHDAAWRERLNITLEPDRLAGLVDLYRTTPQRTKRTEIDYCYKSLLQDMIDPWIPGAKPWKVDFHKLVPAARPYLLAPFLGLVVGGVYPRLCLDTSNPSNGKLVYLVVGGLADDDAWRVHLPAINAWLGGHWSLVASTASTIELMRRTPLPNVIPYTRRYLQSGNLFAGIDTATQRPLYIPFAKLSSGTYIPGTSGGGKTNALHILMQSLFANLHLFTAIYAVDGKDGVAMNRYRNIAPDKVKVFYEEQDFWILAHKLTHLMRMRNALQRDNQVDNATRGFIAVVVDEMATFTARPSGNAKSDANKRHATFLDDLAKIAGRGRSVGVRLFLTSQRPIDAQIPMTVRSNCQTVISFRLNTTTDCTMVFDEIDPTADPRKLSTGQAIVRLDDGTIHTVQFPLAQQQRGGS